MAAVPQKTLNWLYDVLKREYRDPNRTYSDLAHALHRHPGFAPRTDVYTFEDGAPALLVHFQGTIPVTFRGNTYRFPISLWVPHSYPYDAPIAYVTPTNDMLIRPGQYVGGDGKIYHPYLAHWRDAWERSNVVDFLSILSDVFAKEPPVISRQQQQQQQHQRIGQPVPPPVPPLPSQIQPQVSANISGLAQSPQGQAGTPGPPAPPPKDPVLGGVGRSVSSPTPGGTSAGPPSSQKPGRYDAPPPLPSQTHVSDQSQQRPPSLYANGGTQRPLSGANYNPQRSSSLRQSHTAQQAPPHGYYHQQPHTQHRPQPQHQPPRPEDPQHHQYPPQQPLQAPPPGHGTASPPPPQSYGERPLTQHVAPGQPPQAQGWQQQYHPTQSSGHAQHPQPQPPHTHQQQHPPQSTPIHHHQQPPPPPPPQQPKPTPAPPPNLLDSPFDIPLSTINPSQSSSAHHSIPAPPIPVNPEKEALLSHLSHVLTQSLHGQIGQTSSAQPALTSQKAALQTTASTLHTELGQLQNLHTHLTTNISHLHASLASSDKVIQTSRLRAQEKDIPHVDEMLVPPTVVARQLYDVACEERGIEAAILALQDGFVRGRVGSDVWSRRTRDLAREGFKRRWMGRKVARGLGLDGAHG